MTFPTVPARADLPPILARAEFTRTMLQNLVVVFEAAAEDRPILVEMRGEGVWAVTPDGTRLCIGLTRPPLPGDA